MTTEQRKNRGSKSLGIAREKPKGFNGVFGRGSWIRTNDLQYPKLFWTVDNSAMGGQRDQIDIANHSFY
jgi:hypothetical protein